MTGFKDTLAVVIIRFYSTCSFFASPKKELNPPSLLTFGWGKSGTMKSKRFYLPALLFGEIDCESSISETFFSSESSILISVYIFRSNFLNFSNFRRRRNYLNQARNSLIFIRVLHFSYFVDWGRGSFR